MKKSGMFKGDLILEDSRKERQEGREKGLIEEKEDQREKKKEKRKRKEDEENSRKWLFFG